ncbi:MAG TPA: hypothetical protein VF268_12590 [Gammaproteobacteria bacterium]
MKSLVNIIAVTVVLALIAMIFYLMYLGTLAVWANVELVDHTTKVVLGAVAGLVLLVSCLMVFGLRSAAFIRARSQLADQRYGLYVHMLTILRAMLDTNCTRQQRQALDVELKQANADFLVLAGAPAIKAYLAFQEALDSDQQDLLEPCFQALWKNLRKDLGFNDDFDVVDIRRMIGVLPKEPMTQENIPAAT